MSTHMTKFNPALHGLWFENDFTNDFVPALDMRTGGLCGGMSYTALDYYHATMSIPRQPFRPANGTTLHSYLYDRQVTSIVSNLDKWAEMGFNPAGARDTELFNWGISAKKGERIDELKQLLDKGTPCVLCLQAHGDHTGNHQVVAVGYDMGRYKGDLGEHIEDFKIFVYDPNHANKMRTLVPDVRRKLYRIAEEDSDGKTWRTYFVDKNYHAERPPSIPNASYPEDGKVRELVLQFYTGGDDLRGGNDNVDVEVKLADGSQQLYRNINRRARWVVNNDESAQVVLRRPTRLEDLHSLTIRTTFGGGVGGDNWDMQKLVIHTFGGVPFNEIKQVGSKRFTGSDRTLVVPLNAAPTLPGQINSLLFTFVTGGDDLRGGNDNLNITVRYSDGRTQTASNVNGGMRWGNGTTNTVSVDLNHAVAPDDVREITLMTTFGGGIGGDNWSLLTVNACAVVGGQNRVLFVHGPKRFTGDDKTLTLRRA